MAIKTFSGKDFDWKNGKGTTTIGRLGLREFPASFYVKSHRTGKAMLFLHDEETMTENEFFDGEAAAYFVPGGNVQVYIWL